MARVQVAGRLGQALVGLVLLLAGAVKVWEPVAFHWEAVSHVELLGLGNPTNTLARLAIALGAVELALGLALICNWRPRQVLPAVTLLMALFVALAGLSLYRGDTGNCGCFGSLIERTPGQSLTENTALLGLLVFAWTTRKPGGAAAWARGRWVVLGGLLLALAVTGVRLGPHLQRLEDSDLRAGVRMSGLQLTGTELDPARATYLVVLFGPRCPHCAAEVPRMNGWSAAAGLPRLLALTTHAQDSPALIKFRTQHRPLYPTLTVSSTDFLRLTGEHLFPRVALVQAGVISRVWESKGLPTVDEIRSALSAGAAATRN